MSDLEPTAGLLLAAGGGVRFRGAAHKLLTEVRGRPLIAYALENMTAAGLASVAVVTGAADVASILEPTVAVVPNPRWEEGQATSLAAGVAWARRAGMSAVVVGLADQPAIPAAAWRAVAAATGTPIAVATYGGRRGHPVRLHRDVWDRLPQAGDAGARVLMAASPELVTELACEGDPTDVDTVEDLARWR
ncbi:MAG TPA: nucleotidyltransferase family protein [Acidimicrobiales bacterium]